MREIWVRLQELPDRAALVRLQNEGLPRWDHKAFLLSDIAGILAGRPHPARPQPRKKPAAAEDSAHRAALRARRIRQKRAREAQLKGGNGDG
ncbi:hypothetical protein [Nocardia niigatensis]